MQYTWILLENKQVFDDQASEMWIYPRVLEMSWTDKISNEGYCEEWEQRDK